MRVDPPTFTNVARGDCWLLEANADRRLEEVGVDPLTFTNNDVARGDCWLLEANADRSLEVE